MLCVDWDFLRLRLWRVVVFCQFVVAFLVEVALDTSQCEAVATADQWIDWSTGYCSYDSHREIKKVYVRQCSLSKFLEVNTKEALHAEFCGPRDQRFRSEAADRSCQSDHCVLVLSVGSIFGVVLILITLGVVMYIYKRNPRTDRKLLSENIYDEAVYDVRPAAQSQRQHTLNAVGHDGENIELVENDLYDMDIPSPKTPKESSASCVKFAAGDCNIYEAVP